MIFPEGVGYMTSVDHNSFPTFSFHVNFQTGSLEPD